MLSITRLSHDTARQRPDHFLALTSMTVEAFDAILSSFIAAYEEHIRQHLLNHGGERSKLPHAHDRLFFILVYSKICPIQMLMVHMFGMSQSRASHWVHTFAPVLKAALGRARRLPMHCLRKLLDVLEMSDIRDIVIDGVDRPIQLPDDPDERKARYNGKKTRLRSLIS